MKKMHTNIFIVLLFTVTISGCAFYKYTHDTPTEKYNQDNAGRWKMLDNENILVVHYGNTIKELYNISFDETSKTLSGDLRAFEGKPLYYYNKVKDINTAKRKLKADDKIAVKQVHFFLNKTELAENNAIKFAVTDINKIDLSKDATGLNYLVNFGIGIGAGIVIGGIILAIACNCPHVYVDNGKGLELSNSLYTGAKAPQLERFDYKQMPDYNAGSSNYSLNIVNELNENQYTNMLELLVAIHKDNVTVIADKQGRLHSIQKPQSPVQALDNGRNNIINSLASLDGSTYKFNADSMSAFSDAYLTFNVPENQQTEGKLILNVRNTPWSGYVYHEFNSLFGKNYSKWKEQNKDKTKEERELWMREQGIQLLVEIKNGDSWQSAGVVELVGETNFSSIVVPLTIPPSSKKLEIRLRSGFMFWELDYAAIDYSSDQELEVQVLKPQSAIGNGGQDYTQAISFDDNIYMEHAGVKNTTKVTFASLKTNPALKRTVILRSKGYYISNDIFTGKTNRKELQKFRNPGELSRFSQKLYMNRINIMAKN